jgi:hypothetical protein
VKPDVRAGRADDAPLWAQRDPPPASVCLEMTSRHADDDAKTSHEGLLTVGRGELVGASTGLAFVALFGAGLISADLLASPAFFEVDASSGQIDAFFVDNRPEAVGLSVCHALAATALLAFGGYVSGVLRRSDGQSGGLAAVALAGASVAAAFLLLSALLFWTLTRPQVAQADPGTAEALLVLSYLAGGPGVALHPSPPSSPRPRSRASGRGSSPARWAARGLPHPCSASPPWPASLGTSPVTRALTPASGTSASASSSRRCSRPSPG